MVGVVRAPWPHFALTLALSRRAGEGELLFGVGALAGVCGIMESGVVVLAFRWRFGRLWIC